MQLATPSLAIIPPNLQARVITIAAHGLMATARTATAAQIGTPNPNFETGIATATEAVRLINQVFTMPDRGGVNRGALAALGYAKAAAEEGLFILKTQGRSKPNDAATASAQHFATSANMLGIARERLAAPPAR